MEMKSISQHFLETHIRIPDVVEADLDPWVNKTLYVVNELVCYVLPVLLESHDATYFTYSYKGGQWRNTMHKAYFDGKRVSLYMPRIGLSGIVSVPLLLSKRQDSLARVLTSRELVDCVSRYL